MTEFLDLLQRLSHLRLFGAAWFGLDLRADLEPDLFIEETRKWNDDGWPAEQPRERFSTGALNASSHDEDEAAIYVDYAWGLAETALVNLAIDLRGPHPTYGTDISLFRETIATVIDWQRPQHVSMAWPVYRMEHHPLDQQRLGLGWLGWVPFALDSKDVPEAAICDPMQGGTFLASQRQFWFAGGPNKDAAAIARAQALDLRLNQLGVLPSVVELRRGDWGGR